MNSLKTVLLLGLMSGILLFGGEAIGGARGLQIGADDGHRNELLQLLFFR